LNILNRRRKMDMPTVAKMPCSMLLKMVTHSPVTNTNRSNGLILQNSYSWLGEVITVHLLDEPTLLKEFTYGHQ
jgi:hypothetical protein